MAVRSLEEARALWREIENPQVPQAAPAKANNFVKRGAASPEPAEAEANESRLRPEQELFFLMSLGSVYESSGKDEIAISCYMNAITDV